MAKKTTVGIAHSDSDLGRPGDYTRQQLDLVKDMIRQVAVHNKAIVRIQLAAVQEGNMVKSA